MIKKLYYFIIAMFVMLFITGCETINAFKTKEIKKEDIPEILKLGLFPSEAGEESFINKIDAWIKENLW
ncbi:MAG: hypothetical protein NC826_05495 [Candidatus Omnitrophica bacterium]|nr:hypothetical protein [Candidatus Omnitrophota bacterium]